MLKDVVINDVNRYAKKRKKTYVNRYAKREGKPQVIVTA
jgi:hypothetical protein